MSHGTNYLLSMLAYDPNRDNLIGCVNSYPQASTGLSEAIFTEYSQQYREYGCYTAAFVSCSSGKIGPWPRYDGCSTMESDRHRNMLCVTTHLCLTGLIDDVMFGKLLLTEAELKAVLDTFLAPYPIC